MSLTIDQILAEAKGEQPEVYGIEKEASAQPSISSDEFSDEEIEKMAGLLQEAELPGDNSFALTEERSFEEKVAEALILTQSLQAISGYDEEAEKLASFRDAAIANGYDPYEVDAFLEKQASKVKAMSGSAKALLGIGGAAALGASGYAGHSIGEKKGKRKGFGVGRRYQHVIEKRNDRMLARKAYRTGRFHQFLRNKRMQQQASSQNK